MIMNKTRMLLLCISIFFLNEKPVKTSSFAFFREENKCNKAFELFKKAEFNKALELYLEIHKKNNSSYEINYRIGYLFLLANKLSLAESYLKRAIQLKPEEIDPKRCLALAHYRQDKFEEAAKLFHEIGGDAKARQLSSFGNSIPYKITSNVDETAIAFTMVDPLPRFSMRVNGKKIIVQLDTGGSELILDSEFAREIGVEIFGSREAVFGGGKKSIIKYGKVKSIRMGDFAIENIPVHILQMGTTSFQGIVGTNLLYHFLSTIDYTNKQLLLRSKSTHKYEEHLEGLIKVPFWLEGDHFMLAWGTADDSRPLVYCVDTGLAGGAFYFPLITAERLGLKINKNDIRRKHGGGGMFEYYPSKLNRMTLGTAIEKNLNGIIVNDDGLLKRYEYEIAGIISHDFFKNYAITFDFSKMEILLSRN